MPSHLNEKGKEKRRKEALDSGLVTLDDIIGNDQADKLADDGAKTHPNIKQHVRSASMKKEVTIIIQKMYCAIWGEHIEAADKKTQDIENNEAEDLDAYLRQLEQEALDEEYNYDPFDEGKSREDEFNDDDNPSGKVAVHTIPPPAAPVTKDETSDGMLIKRFPNYGWAAN